MGWSYSEIEKECDGDSDRQVTVKCDRDRRYRYRPARRNLDTAIELTEPIPKNFHAKTQLTPNNKPRV